MSDQADLFQALFDNFPEAILIADDNRRYVAANPAACQLLGVSSDEITKFRIDDFAAPHLREQIELAWKSFIDEGLQKGEYELVRRDGTLRKVVFSANANFVPGLHVSSLRDVTEQRLAEARAEEELRKVNERLEAAVEQRTAALRVLSARLLQLRDEEQRKIARELHDSVGQDLTSVLITLDLLSRPDLDRDQLISDTRQTVERLLSEIRTLSHLLHPPLLDEAGLASATRWLVEGFAARSGVEVNLELDTLPRLPAATEVMLFRVLQECMTNVHRHSESGRADVRLVMDKGRVKLQVRDYGRGIPSEKLEQFRKSGSGAGIGLAGIRERVIDTGGYLEIANAAPGTIITLTVPVESASHEEGKSSAA